MALAINGRVMDIRALANWLAELPDDFLFARENKTYTCECLVGRYFNQPGGREVGVGFSELDVLEATDEGKPYPITFPLTGGMEDARALYDYLMGGRENVTAGELRRAIVLYILLGGTGGNNL